MTKLKKELISIFGITIILFISAIIFFLCAKYLLHNYGLYALLGYILISVGLFIIQKKVKNKIISGVITLLTIPFYLIFILLTFSVPIFMLIFDFGIFFMCILIIPTIWRTIDTEYNSIAIPENVDSYLTITIPLITILLFHKHILKLINYLNENMYGKGTSHEQFKLNDLANYVFEFKTIKFLIYTTYFIFLFFYSIYIINKQHFLSEDDDRVVLQSFLSFIAFDRLVSNAKDFSIIPSTLFDKLITRLRQE